MCDDLRAIIQTDPVRLAPHVDPDRVMMVVALFDHSVASENQWELWRALGKPRVTVVPLGHYNSILTVPFHRVAVLHFFEDQFATDVKPSLRVDAAVRPSQRTSSSGAEHHL